jgi:uncharacterized phage protein (TIGR02218 family)
MKPVSPELLTLLATRQFYVADCYSINLQTGGSLYYCSGDADLVVNGITYSAGGQIGPYWDRTDNKAKCHWKVGVDVDSLVVDVIPGTAQVLGISFLQAIRQGVFDGADVILDRVFMPTYGDTSRGIVRFFVGRIANIDCPRDVATFTVTSHLELLNQQFPNNLYQAGCVNNLGDTACGVTLSSYMSTGTVSSGATASSIPATISGSFQAGYFDLGTITFTSGVLNGQTLTIKTCAFGSPSTVSLLGYVATLPSSGDTFNIYAGCNKSCDLPLTVNGIMTAGQNNLVIVNGSVASAAMTGYTITGYGVPASTTVIGYHAGAYPSTVAGGVSSTNGNPPMPYTGELLLSNNFTLSSPGTSHAYTLTKPGTVLNGCGKFNNRGRFRGAPFIPVPSTAAG